MLDTEVTHAHFAEFLGKAFVDFPVAAGLPCRVHCSRQRVNERVHVTRVEVVLLIPSGSGQHDVGVKAGGAMRAVFDSVGIHDVLAKSKGSSNPHNLVKATIAALTEMRDAYTVAGLRGIPMSRVFNG